MWLIPLVGWFGLVGLVGLIGLIGWLVWLWWLFRKSNRQLAALDLDNIRLERDGYLRASDGSLHTTPISSPPPGGAVIRRTIPVVSTPLVRATRPVVRPAARPYRDDGGGTPTAPSSFLAEALTSAAVETLIETAFDSSTEVTTVFEPDGGTFGGGGASGDWGGGSDAA
jgi:hypothetical protein